MQDVAPLPVRRVLLLDGHGVKRVSELGTAFTAHPIRASANREYTTQIAVVAPE